MQRVIILAGIAVAALLSGIWSAQAAPESPPKLESPTAIEGWCNEHGGIYMPPGGGAETYGCLLPDGSILICGGGIACDLIPPTLTLPVSKLPLDAVGLVMEVQTQVKLEALQDKLDLLQTTMEELGVLVEDECEPPIFVP